ncbi:hypothetical protein BGZ83_001225 [Gryganskiella cystojenkinii]|nr:hypothetical protein BGZ83_001225 [Gryganskiella cystojenkinii]
MKSGLYQQQSASEPSSLPSPRRRLRSSALSFLLATATCLLSTSFWSSGFVEGKIICDSPQNGTYHAGDPMVLQWSSDMSNPTVSDLRSLKATLFCDSGILIGGVDIVLGAAPISNWIVPSVGNATTAGGNAGTCVANTFHIQYSGTYMSSGLFGGITNLDPVSCPSLTILPAPNITLPTTTPTVNTTTSVSMTSTSTISKSRTTTTTTTSTGTPTSTTDQGKSPGLSSTVIIVVAIVAGLILILVALGIIWYVRRQRRIRMENAVMPWSNQPNNQFAKMSSSMEDDGPRSLNGRSPGVAAAGAAYGAGKNKPLPPVGGYYQEDGYGGGGYGGGYGGQQHGYEGYDQGYESRHAQAGYNGGYTEDDYYNPYYAQGGAPGTPAAGHPGPGQGYYNRGGSNADMYGVSSAVARTQSGRVAGPGGGYYPPPPPTSSSPAGSNSPPSSAAAAAIAANSSLNSLPLTTSSTLFTSSPSERRGPQLVVTPEKSSEQRGPQLISQETPTDNNSKVPVETIQNDIPLRDLSRTSSPR